MPGTRAEVSAEGVRSGHRELDWSSSSAGGARESPSAGEKERLGEANILDLTGAIVIAKRLGVLDRPIALAEAVASLGVLATPGSAILYENDLPDTFV